jgi:hypothetical protein
MEAKPVVDGIERDVGDRATVLRVDLLSQAGAAIAARFGVEFTPTFLMFDRRGALVERLSALARDRVASRLVELSR